MTYSHTLLSSASQTVSLLAAASCAILSPPLFLFCQQRRNRFAGCVCVPAPALSTPKAQHLLGESRPCKRPRASMRARQPAIPPTDGRTARTAAAEYMYRNPLGHRARMPRGSLSASVELMANNPMRSRLHRKGRDRAASRRSPSLVWQTSRHVLCNCRATKTQRRAVPQTPHTRASRCAPLSPSTASVPAARKAASPPA